MNKISVYLPINLPIKKRDSVKNTRILYVFMRYVRLPESRLEAEVYKFKRFTVNLFINETFIV
jgi:hypothetical protein